VSKVTVEFKTDNAAFRDDETGALDREAVADMLQQAGEKIAGGRHAAPLIDVNGNIVGNFYIVED